MSSSRSINHTLAVFRYLWENTDEAHPASIADISAHLVEAGIPVKDARTIRSDIAQLLAFGIDIAVDRKVQNQYFIATRFFQAPEIKLLIDAVQCARFISDRKSRALIDKLSVFAGPEQNDVLRRQLYVDRRFRTNSESVYLVVDWIQSTISKGKKISFQYSEYGPDKEKRLRHGGQRYIFSPYCMVWNNDSYYAVGYSDSHKKIVKYRVDRMEALELMPEAQEARPKDFDVAEYFSQEFSMLDGTECSVELICENALMNSVIDRFGEQVETEILDEGHFRVVATVDLSSNFYGWVFASAGKMRIVGPPEAVEEFHAICQAFFD